ncbi:GDP-mannose 4,6-dehydratase [Daejeonella sp.]|uniref:GDP-mannose 4,6-dehydratase n=1 Tax=Daejeonella sp. TaxID=2805397 RepID=UPI0030BFD297
MKAIVIGSAGQDGIFLSELLTKKGVDVIGISRSGGQVRGSIVDYDFIAKQILEHQPDYIFHFAARSTTRHEALFENHETISTGTLNILEAVRIHCPHSKIFLSGSAMQFVNSGLPIDENTPFHASSPYAVSRIQSVYAGRYYREKFDLKVYVGYFFNHDSPHRSEQHVNQKIVAAAKRILAGSEEKLLLGNIDVKKEFNYAGDIVNAIWLLVNQDHIHEAVIGSGMSYSIREWLEYCFDKIGKNWNDYVEKNEDFKAEYDILVSNPKIIKSLGWKPAFTFEGLANLMLQ